MSEDKDQSSKMREEFTGEYKCVVGTLREEAGQTLDVFSLSLLCVIFLRLAVVMQIINFLSQFVML